MAFITIVTGAYKPTYNWGASHCSTMVTTLDGYINKWLHIYTSDVIVAMCLTITFSATVVNIYMVTTLLLLVDIFVNAQVAHYLLLSGQWIQFDDIDLLTILLLLNSNPFHPSSFCAFPETESPRLRLCLRQCLPSEAGPTHPVRILFDFVFTMKKII
jgi:type IV secretory pathway VirB3-like protein